MSISLALNKEYHAGFFGNGMCNFLADKYIHAQAIVSGWN